MATIDFTEIDNNNCANTTNSFDSILFEKLVELQQKHEETNEDLKLCLNFFRQIKSNNDSNLIKYIKMKDVLYRALIFLKMYNRDVVKLLEEFDDCD